MCSVIVTLSESQRSRAGDRAVETTATFGKDRGAAAFFARLQLDEMKVQSSMLILRQCGVPKMNYALRCTPPPCIAVQAAAFDELVLRTAKAKLLLHDDETDRQPTVERLRAPLRHGGFGLTSALLTSPAAFLGSLAAVASAPAFAQHARPDGLLPRASLLHGWIESSMDAITDVTPECTALLPAAAPAFFQHFSPPSTPKPSSLQHKLSLQATQSVYTASLQRTQDMKKMDGGLALSHLRAISAPRAWTWKTVAPTSRELELSDTEYRISARLNLGLQPIDGAEALPPTCPCCGNYNAIRDDCWHFVSCSTLTRDEISVRHDSVSRALYRCALLMGLTARLEPTGLDPNPKSRLRPDLLLTLPGRHILTDVAVVHPLTAGRQKAEESHAMLGAARSMEAAKRRKYAALVAARQYQLHPFVLETCGGMAPAAERLVDIMAEAGEAHLRVWAKEGIIKELLESVAIAVQRGTALSYLHGYEQALRMLRLTEGDAEEQSAAARRRSGWKRKHPSRAGAAAGAA